MTIEELYAERAAGRGALGLLLGLIGGVTAARAMQMQAYAVPQLLHPMFIERAVERGGCHHIFELQNELILNSRFDLLFHL